MKKKVFIFLAVIGLLLSTSIAKADTISDLYGTWTGLWSWDTVIRNPRAITGPSDIVKYLRQYDDTWISDNSSPLPGWFYSYLGPNELKDVTLTLHAVDALGYYGNIEAEASPNTFFTGVITDLSLTGNTFNVSILEDYATATIYGNFENSLFSNARFDESDTPLDGYMNFRGNLALESAAVPEPATMLLFGSGMVGLFFRRKKQS